jgi:hypothetical protein
MSVANTLPLCRARHRAGRHCWRCLRSRSRARRMGLEGLDAHFYRLRRARPAATPAGGLMLMKTRGQRLSVHVKCSSGTPSTRKHAGQRSSPRLASMVACGLARRSPRKFVNIQPPAGVAAGRARRGLSSAIDQNVIVHAQRHLLRRSNCPLLCNFRQ